MAVFAPMPSARVRMAMAENPGFLRSMRKANRKSCNAVSMKGRPRSSRLVSFSCMLPPSRMRAARAASSGFMPRRIFSCVARSTCVSISCWNSRSMVSGEACARNRETRDLRKASIAGSAPFVDAKNAADYIGDAAPILRFSMELFAAGFGDGVEAGFAIVFGRAPLGGDPSFVEKADERGVDRALIDLQGFFADLLDAACDAVAVKRAHGSERFEDHEVEGALEDFGFGVGGHGLRLRDGAFAPVGW